MKTETAKTTRTSVRRLRTRRGRETLAEAQARVESAFGMWRKYAPGGKVDWDLLEEALAEGKRERIAAVQQMTERWRWNERDKCWEKGPAKGSAA